MSNMSYCRFHNTAQDLQDCVYAIQEEIFNGEPLESRMELEGLQRILDLIEEIEELSPIDITVFPNPSIGLFTVNSLDTIISYSIIDLLGQQVLLKEHLNLTVLNIDITSLSNGMYFIELEKEDGGIIKKKIIKI